MKALAVEYLISWEHAIRMFKKMSLKRHQPAGYFFDIQATNDIVGYKLTREKLDLLYSDRYKLGVQLFHLKVWREAPIAPLKGSQ